MILKIMRVSILSQLFFHLATRMVLVANAQLGTQAGQYADVLRGPVGLPLTHLLPKDEPGTIVEGAARATPSPSTPGARPHEVYNGGYSDTNPIRLRIANGGAGQSGLIREWATAFIRYMVQSNGSEPFQVAWYLGDTTDSLAMLDAGTVDVAATYNPAAEQVLLNSGAATMTAYAFRGYFALVGPKGNPAKLDSAKDNILSMFSKIAVGGKNDDQRPPNPSERLPVRFLSRFDKSATNIRESELFLKIGQIPWALAYAKWYHQYPQFPVQSLRAASVLGEYTLTDTGILATVAKSDDSSFLKQLEVFRAGSPDDQDEEKLLNPCHVLLGAKADPTNLDTATAFMDWLVQGDGGRRVVREFGRNGKDGFFEPPR